MTVCPMNYQPPARTGETLPAPKDTDVEPLYLRYVPTSIGRIFTHIRSFKANYGLFPNRIMMSESFASEQAARRTATTYPADISSSASASRYFLVF